MFLADVVGVMLDRSILRVGLGSDFWKYGEEMYSTSVLSSFSIIFHFDQFVISSFIIIQQSLQLSSTM